MGVKPRGGLRFGDQGELMLVDARFEARLGQPVLEDVVPCLRMGQHHGVEPAANAFPRGREHVA